MARIRLLVREADGELPMVCMRCGEPATVVKTKNMAWCPPWVPVLILAGVIVYIIVAIILTKRARLQAPLCDEHKGHWLYRQLIIWGTFLPLLVIGIAAVVGISNAPNQVRNILCPFFGIGGLVALIAGVVLLAVAQSTAIRPKEITDREILLEGVADEFVQAVEEMDRDRRARRRVRRGRWEDDWESDEEPAPPRSIPSDAFKEQRRPRKGPPPDAIEE